MGSYPTGVTIVSAVDESGVPYGLTVNSFTSVSLDPPLVLVCIGHTSTSHDRLVAGAHFVVNILSAAQGEAATRFATEPSEGRFDAITWRSGASGAPILHDTTAWLECEVQEVMEGGDHSILIGRVLESWVGEEPALLFHRGRLSTTHG
jgi:flavin reductase (DIM6/NTAB) family NADH-FMN oxidoreductase RutF